MRWLDGITDSTDVSVSMPFCCGEADCCGQGGRHIYRLWWLQVYWRLGRLLVWLAAQSLGGGVSLLLTC